MRTKSLLGRVAEMSFLVAAVGPSLHLTVMHAQEPEWREALTFHASFDNGTDADFGSGDRRLFHAPTIEKRKEAAPGLPAGSPVVLVRDQGRFGGALRFKAKSELAVFYQAAKNLAYRASDWSGTVSFWLSTDPAGELAPGFCDPIQITPREWNDAAFFVEFEIRESIPFRLAAYADFAVWNQKNRKFEEIPPGERPLLTVEKPPFGRGQWTHVVFTFDHFNTGRDDGVARLYLNGKSQGLIPARRQTFTWDPGRTHIMLGLSYVGLFDELSIFNRALTDAEVLSLNQLPKGVSALVK